jgi:hypothetical protein
VKKCENNFILIVRQRLIGIVCIKSFFSLPKMVFLKIFFEMQIINLKTPGEAFFSHANIPYAAIV